MQLTTNHAVTLKKSSTLVNRVRDMFTLSVQHAEPGVVKLSLSPWLAVSDHPWLLSDTTIWSLSRQTACAIGQFSGIPTPLVVGHATIQNSTNNLTNKLQHFQKNNNNFFGCATTEKSTNKIHPFQKPTFFPKVADTYYLHTV